MGFCFMMILISESLLPNKSTVVLERPGGWNVACANHILNSELLEKPIEIPDSTHLGSQPTLSADF